MGWRLNTGTMCILSLATCLCGRALAGPTIATSEALSPEQEKASIHLPPGFELQLVASEPDIHKPINIAFDDRGRLWVTDTVEYPFPVEDGKPTRDTIKILEDFGPDGHARKITTFADNLNIPVGVLPLPTPADPSGKGTTAIIHSIPDVWRMTDTAGSGKADKREVLLSAIGHQDTHGMTGSFTEGFDGRIYACHGFKNTSTVKGTDGSEIVMNSGNTYRFRPDGSRIEYFTHGQVNPFGLAWDPLGNLYSSDCETKPVYMLIREAYYPSFGKPDDGLGFAPQMCDHLYGSTAIAGLVDYVDDKWPAEYRDTMFVGNVVTNVVNHCKLTPHGSWFHADDLPDFCVSSDLWFRPVHLKLGPDGNLYIADFYNRIIGHYEVDLHHPGRDKQRGRIWRIVYHGADGKTPIANPPDFSKSSPQQLVDDLADPNLTVRMMAINRLADVTGEPAIESLKAALAAPKNADQTAGVLWVLHRLGALDDGALAKSAQDAQEKVRVHAMRVLGDTPAWNESLHDLALAGLKDAYPTVRRCAVEAIGAHASARDLRAILDLREHVPVEDTHLLHTARIALRDILAAPGALGQVPLADWTAADEKAVLDVVPGLATTASASFVIRHLQGGNEDHSTTVALLHHAARYAPEQEMDELARIVTSRFAGDTAFQLELLKSIIAGLGQRGGTASPALRDWGGQLASKILDAPARAEDPAAWVNHPVPNRNPADPWVVEVRKSADGDTTSTFFTSFPKGETLTGSLHSRPFAAPQSLSFYLAGQDGPPSVRIKGNNFARVRAADTDEVLAQVPVPRNDVAKKVTWDLTKWAGKLVYFEATDANSDTSYAWIAVGRFDPPVIVVPAVGTLSRSQQQLAALEIVESLKLADLAGPVRKLMAERSGDPAVRAAAVKALISVKPADPAGLASMAEALGATLDDSAAPTPLRETAAAALGNIKADAARQQLLAAFQTAPQGLQKSIALALAGTNDGAESLLAAVAQGKASARLLTDGMVRAKLDLGAPADLDARIAKLTKGIVTADQTVQKLIDQRAAAFEAVRSDPAKASLARGAEVFAKNCTVCHSIGGQGARIGPQLDGIGKRGPERLCEDILDPSRNVDAAFRYSILTLDNGDVLTGLQRREEGETLVFADSQGKEFTVAKKQVVKRVESQLSLMPANFGDTISAEDFNHLLAFLVTK